MASDARVNNNKKRYMIDIKTNHFQNVSFSGRAAALISDWLNAFLSLKRFHKTTREENFPFRAQSNENNKLEFWQDNSSRNNTPVHINWKCQNVSTSKIQRNVNTMHTNNYTFRVLGVKQDHCMNHTVSENIWALLSWSWK